ncbi:hypothetical protein TWF225_009452 [Orbilia oligospora]|uniref:Uncharacterized protein n=1 Tax=Orbilia oligospora TaxID=2813651 RepID=A0A7C8KNG4_ORBOL|nr:hypothetical protein TWF751_007515 [Orbilia oligospora]KAF3174730.1 hypothetical protein TWF225_009452 [Orbilia oligospora]KAF3259436.1 hypothetical protein TWF217_005134 [Orbilia oligospora]KAF3263918.1 hypothetical protein TWF128_001554 [Orbilia oligospora]KAF3290176.1 hypothetical protein TWF132_007175 [Orbilia oligospora]
MSSEVSCVLCGAFLRTSRYRPTSPLCILHPRIIGHSYEGLPAWITTEYVGAKGTAPAFDLDDPQLEIWDNALSSMVRLDSSYQIGRARERQCLKQQVPCKPCYLMHYECWGLFKIVAVKLGVQESDLPLYQCHLYRAFDAAAYDGGNLIWPHSYHLTPEEVLAYRFFRPGAAYSYLEPHGLDHIGYSELQVATPHVYYREPAKHKDILAERANINIPDFLPLPVELTHKVLCCLPGTDIIALSKMKSFKTLQVPDFVWKSQFDLGAELGFLVQPHFMTDVAETTWQAKYLFTKKIISENYRAAANLKRRWDIFTSLVHKLRDTDNCDEANIYDLDPEGPREFGYNVDQDQALVCQSLPQKLHPGDTNGILHSEGVKIRAGGNLKRFVTTGMYVSYTGAGKLRFVSGFRFLPGGEKLGLINPEDEEYVHLQKAMASTQVIWVATSKYGIRNITIVPRGIDYLFENLEDVYVNRKMLIIKPEGIEISKFAVTVGLSEITSLCIYSPNFINGGDLDRQEWFVQRYSWSPTIPPIFSKHRMDIDHDSFCGHLNYITERARHEAACLDHIVFANLSAVRFTCWLGTRLEICGIGVFIEGKETPLVIGTKTDFSTDAAIEKDEAIISLELLIGGKDSLPVGLSVRTDRGVAFHFIIPNLPQKPRKHTLDVGKDKEIVGIFAGFNGSLSNSPIFQILALGTISSGRRSLPTNETETRARKTPSNPQLRLWNESTDGPCPKDILLNDKHHLGYFISTAPLANCKSLECYVQDNHYGYCITGICLSYGKEADSPQQCPAVLGHLSSTATKNILEIEADRGEYIVAVDVYIRKVKLAPNLEFSLAVVGIVFWTSSRRKISCGKCQAEYASKVLPLRTSIEEDFVLKWIYSRNVDYLTNVKEF